MARIVLGVSGASGVVLGWRALHALVQGGHEVELVMTASASYTAQQELGKHLASATKWVESLPLEEQSQVRLHAISDVGSTIASGSYPTDGLLILPCSMHTLACVAHGLSDNALLRAASVTLKERRRFVLVPRETPLSEIHLEQMLKLSRMGVTILPPMPAWYQRPQSLEAMEMAFVGRALEAMGIASDLAALPWRGATPSKEASGAPCVRR